MDMDLAAGLTDDAFLFLGVAFSFSRARPAPTPSNQWDAEGSGFAPVCVLATIYPSYGLQKSYRTGRPAIGRKVSARSGGITTRTSGREAVPTVPPERREHEAR